MSAVERFQNFLREVRVEARKVTWPSVAELREATIVVLVTVAIISLFIAVVDRIVGQAVTYLLTLGA